MSKEIDLTFNTESWLSGEGKDNTYLAELLPPTYDIVHKPREIGRGVEDRERLRTLLGEWIVRYSKCYYEDSGSCEVCADVRLSKYYFYTPTRWFVESHWFTSIAKKLFTIKHIKE